MAVVKRIGVLSFAKIYTPMAAIFGLIIGAISAVMQAATPLPPQAAGPMPPALGWWAIIVFPALYAVVGFLSSLVGAALYNLLAGWLGGVEIELEK